jgi:hypothetical protein
MEVQPIDVCCEHRNRTLAFALWLETQVFSEHLLLHIGWKHRNRKLAFAHWLETGIVRTLAFALWLETQEFSDHFLLHIGWKHRKFQNTCFCT